MILLVAGNVFSFGTKDQGLKILSLHSTMPNTMVAMHTVYVATVSHAHRVYNLIIQLF